MLNGCDSSQGLPKLDDGRPTSGAPYILPRNETEWQLIRIWEKVLGVHPVGIRDDFFALGGHSLLAVQLLAQVEKKLGIHMPLSALLEAPTIEQSGTLLLQKRAAMGASLIPVQVRGSRPPFFCVHGADSYIHFRRHLGIEQPFYGLAQHLSGRKVRYIRIPDLAAHYIREMRKVQPEGPYFLGGHSMGGIIAFEMAQQLRGRGEEVAFLALLDPGLPRQPANPFAPRRWRDQACAYGRELYQTISQLGCGDLLEQIQSSIAYGIKSLACRTHHLFRVVLPPSLQTFYIDQVVYGMLYAKAMRRYWPSVYPGAVDFFKCELDMRESITVWHKKVAGPFAVHQIPGDHQTMLREPHVGHLVEKLTECLSKAQSGSATPALISRNRTKFNGWMRSKNYRLERTWFGKFLNQDAE